MQLSQIILITLASLAYAATSLEDDDYPRDVIASVLRAAREKRGIADDIVSEVKHCRQREFRVT